MRLSHRRPRSGAARRLQPALGPASLALATLIFCWKLLSGELVVIGYDTMTYMYPYRFFAAAALGEGRIPLWNPDIYYGVPFLANLQSAVFYPLHILFLVRPPTEAMNWSVMLHLFLAALFTYLLGRVLAGLDRVGATVAGALYGLGGFVGSQVGHLNQLNAAVWLPAALLVEHRALAERRPRWIALLALILAVQLLAGHAQESYMTLVLLAGYAVFFVARRAFAVWRPSATWSWTVPLNGRANGSATAGQGLLAPTPPPALMLTPGFTPLPAGWRDVWGEVVWAAGALVLAGALAGALAAMQLLPTNELTGLSIRAAGMSLAEASSFSLPPRQLFVGLLPTFGLASPTSNEYLGWVGFGGLTLALMGLLFGARRPATLFFAIVLGASFLLALGNHTPVFERVFHVPGMNLFRVPARWLLLTSLALAILAGTGLAALRQMGRVGWPAAGPWHRLTAATRLLVGVLAVAVGAALAWPLQRAGTEGFPPALLAIWLTLAGGAIALAFLSLAAAPSSWPAALFVLWVFAELFGASRSLEYNNPNPQAVYTASRPVIDALRQGQGPQRRLLSIAATGYHPSDAEGLVAAHRDRLGPRGVLATLINTKYKEILNPNLSMVFGLPTVDGYDGGVLPLRRYITFKRLVVPPEGNLPDSLLRDQLRQLPPAGRLRLLAVSDLILDTMGDATQEDVFYDLAATVTFAPGESLRFTRLSSASLQTPSPMGTPSSTAPPSPPPPVTAGPLTAVGLVTSLEGADAVPDGAPVATVTLGDAGGARWSADLIAGRDTAAADHSPAARHRRPSPLLPDRPGPSVYLARLPVDDAPAGQGATWIAVQSHLPGAIGRLRVHGISLIGTSQRAWPVTLLGESLRLVHRSDVKLYRDDGTLPRAYVAPAARAVDGPDAALGALGAETHRPDRVALLERDPGPPPPTASAWRARLRRLRDGVMGGWLGIDRDPHPGTVPAGLELPGEGALRGEAEASSAPASGVTWMEDAPERVVLRVTSAGPGLLVLRDTFYPGWTVRVNDQPAPLLRADVLFRAVPLPAGDHTVEFRFRSLPLERGLLIAAVAAGLTLALAALPWRRPLPPAPDRA